MYISTIKVLRVLDPKVSDDASFRRPPGDGGTGRRGDGGTGRPVRDPSGVSDKRGIRRQGLSRCPGQAGRRRSLYRE